MVTLSHKADVITRVQFYTERFCCVLCTLSLTKQFNSGSTTGSYHKHFAVRLPHTKTTNDACLWDI